MQAEIRASCMLVTLPVCTASSSYLFSLQGQRLMTPQGKTQKLQIWSTEGYHYYQVSIMSQPLYVKHFLYFIIFSLIHKLLIQKLSPPFYIEETISEYDDDSASKSVSVLFSLITKNLPSKVSPLDQFNHLSSPCLQLCR